jgi:hypothetical protein
VAFGFAFDFGIVEAAPAVVPEAPAAGVAPHDQFIRAPTQTPQSQITMPIHKYKTISRSVLQIISPM